MIKNQDTKAFKTRYGIMGGKKNNRCRNCVILQVLTVFVRKVDRTRDGGEFGDGEDGTLDTGGYRSVESTAASRKERCGKHWAHQVSHWCM